MKLIFGVLLLLVPFQSFAQNNNEPFIMIIPGFQIFAENPEPIDCYGKIMESLDSEINLVKSNSDLQTYLDIMTSALASSQPATYFQAINQDTHHPRFTPKYDMNKCQELKYLTEGIRQFKEIDVDSVQAKTVSESLAAGIEVLLDGKNHGKNTACMLDCQVNLAKKNSEELNCFKHCGLEENTGNLSTYSEDTEITGGHPFKFCKDISSVQLQAVAAKSMEMSAAVQSQSEAIVPSLEKLKKELATFTHESVEESVAILEGKLSKLILEDPYCEEANASLTSDLQSSSVHINDQSGKVHGSSFFARTNAGNIYQITAHHVASENHDNRYQSAKFNKMIFGKGDDVEKLDFQIKPGLYDRSRDVVALEPQDQSIKTSLTLPEAGEQLEIGQELTIAGYPGSRKLEWTTFTCYLQGYINLDDGSDSKLLLHCPTISDSIGGMSGGPVIDIQRRVWGVVTMEAQFGNHVMVSPIFQKDNKLTIGPGVNLISSHCYRFEIPTVKKTGACHVYSGNNIEY